MSEKIFQATRVAQTRPPLNQRLMAHSTRGFPVKICPRGHSCKRRKNQHRPISPPKRLAPKNTQKIQKNTQNSTVFCVLFPKISTGQKKIAPTGRHGWHVFATLLGAPPRAKISETCHFQLFLLLTFQKMTFDYRATVRNLTLTFWPKNFYVSQYTCGEARKKFQGQKIQC